MKLEKVFSTILFFGIIFGFAAGETHAQSTKFPQQTKILNNYGLIPFEDGKTVIADVKFSGLDTVKEEYDESIGKSLTESDCWKVLRESRSTITVGDKFYGGKVSKTVKVVREWLTLTGYDRAEIIAFGEKLPKNKMNLIFSIKRGKLASVSEIVFDGNVHVSNEELVADFKQCINNGWKIFDSRKYEYITRKCSRTLLLSKGFFQAKINSINRRLVEGYYVVTIGIHEGIRYRIGEINIEGAKVFTEKEILEMLEQKTGDIANGKLFINFINEQLKKRYADNGYMLYDAEFEPDLIEPVAESLDGIVDLKIIIEEGPQFKLAGIKFSGIEEEKAQELRKLFSIKDGDIFIQSKIDEGIKKINEMQEFDFVDKDSNVDIQTDEASSELTFRIDIWKGWQ